MQQAPTSGGHGTAGGDLAANATFGRSAEPPRPGVIVAIAHQKAAFAMPVLPPSRHTRPTAGRQRPGAQQRDDPSRSPTYVALGQWRDRPRPKEVFAPWCAD